MKSLFIVFLCTSLLGCNKWSETFNESRETEENLVKLQNEISDCKSINKSYKVTVYSSSKLNSDNKTFIDYSLICISKTK